MKKSFLLLIFILSIIIKPILIHADTDTLGIEFEQETDDFLIFSPCSSEFRDLTPIKLTPRGAGSWGKILEGPITDSEFKKNWGDYVAFFKECKKISPPGQSSFAQEYEQCTDINYYIPKDISKWKDYCGLTEASDREEVVIPVPSKKDVTENKYSGIEIIDAVEIFYEEENVITKFVEGDYRKLKARTEQEDEQFSDETLLQKKEDIIIGIKNFQEALINVSHLILHINNKLCDNQSSGCEIQSKKDSYEAPPGSYKKWEDYLAAEKKFNNNINRYKNITKTVDELLNKEINSAKINQQILNEQNKKAEEKRKKAEEQKEKAEEQRTKEEEKRKKDEKQKNDKIKKKFNDVVSSLENLENDTFLKLSERIEDLSNTDISENLEASLKEINKRIQQEESIRKEISSLVKKYKQQTKKLESQDFAKLQLPVFEQRDASLKVLDEIEQLSSLLDKKLEDLENKKTAINKKINSDETWGTVFNILFYVILFVIVGIVSFLSYRSGKKSSNSSNGEKNNADIRELTLKIKLLEEQNSKLEKIISKNLSNKKDSIAEKSKDKSPEVKEVTEEEIKAQQDKERSMAYDDALENPNLISKFVDMYGVVGLDKAVKVAKGENAILKRDDKAIERSNFWGMPNPNPKNTSGDQWIIFPGRTLQSNAAALIADDSRYGRELLNGIFKFEVGSTFRVIGLAIAIKEQDGFRIVSQGNLVLPK